MSEALETPGLHLLLGPPNAGKMGRVLEWWQGLRHRDPLVIVPSRADVGLLEHELARRQGALLGPRAVGTADDLVTSILGGRPARLGRLAQRLLLLRVLRETKLTALAPLAGFPGTLGALAALFEELDESGVSEAAVMVGLQAWSAAAGPGTTAADVGALYEAFAAERGAAGAVSRGQALLAAAAGRQRWQRPVCCYGFSSLTPAQRHLLVSLAEVVPVLVSLPVAESGPLAALPERAHWEGIADRVERLPWQRQAFSDPGLADFARQVIEAGVVTEAGSDGTGVRLLLSSGRRNEIESVAAEVVRLLREGFRPDDIALIVRRLEPWHRLIGQVFSAYGIPHRVEAQVGLSRTGLGYALLRALEGLLERQPQPLLDYLRSPYAGLPRERVDAVEVDLHRRRLLGGPPLLRWPSWRRWRDRPTRRTACTWMLSFAWPRAWSSGRPPDRPLPGGASRRTCARSGRCRARPPSWLSAWDRCLRPSRQRSWPGSWRPSPCSSAGRTSAGWSTCSARPAPGPAVSW